MPQGEFIKQVYAVNGTPTDCVHLAVTLRHAQPGVAERFAEDLKASVAQVAESPKEKGGMAPVYGLANTIPVRGAVDDMLTQYMDLLYKV